MSSTPDLNTVNPDAALAARADERLVHAYEQIARADEQLARVTEQLSRLERDDARRPAAIPAWQQPSRGRPALRGFIGFVLAAGICAAAFAANSSYGEATRQTIAPWLPSFVSTSWLAPGKPAEAAQPGSSPVQLAAAETTIQQPTPLAQTPVQDVPPASAPTPASPDLTQMLQAMARDIATVEQGIEQLKAGQAQMAADNARAIEQLRASQEQLTRLAARPAPAEKPADRPAAAKPKPAEEQATRAKPPAPAPQARPVASAAHKPPQARAPAQPIQLQPDDQ